MKAPEFRPKLWDYAAQYLRPAMKYEHRPITFDAIKAEYLAGQSEILYGAKSAILIRRMPDGPVSCLHVYLAGGQLGEIVGTLLPRAQILAEQAGCSSIVIDGRKGWARVLRKSGFGVARKAADWWLVSKPLFPKTFKERVLPLTAINYAINADYIALSTDTLATHGLDWYPGILTTKAELLPRLDAIITANCFSEMLRNCYNHALVAPVSDIIELATTLPTICRQSFAEALNFSQSIHPPEEDYSWAVDCAVTVLGWSPAHGRLIGLRFSYSNNFEAQVLGDGVFTQPNVPEAPLRITRDRVGQLCELTLRQQALEMRRTPTDRNAIGGDIMLYEMSATAGGTISTVRRVHRFDTYAEDMNIIRARPRAIATAVGVGTV